MNKKDKLLSYLKENTFIMLSEARKMGLSPMMLSRLAAKEEIYRIAHGVYAHELEWLTDPLKKYISTCALYPKAVISGISALTYYGLTDVEERQIWIALPAPHIIHNPRYRLIRPSGISYSLGITRHRFGKRTVRIYDLEKSVVDAFKYTTEKVALKALKAYLKRKDKDVQKLSGYARRLRKPLDEIITILGADE